MIDLIKINDTSGTLFYRNVQPRGTTLSTAQVGYSSPLTAS